MGARLSLAVVLAVSFLAGGRALGGEAAPPVGPEQLYQRAVEACLEGYDPGRRAALKSALRIDPDYAPARAEFGYVWLEGEWRLAEDAQAAAADDPRRHEYERLRSSASDTVEDHKRLARWCDANGLTHEARPHWLMVLRAEPTNRAALGSLDVVMRDGVFVSRDSAATADEETERRLRAAREWDRRLRRVERADASDDTIARLRDEIDRDAIDPVERRVASLADEGNAKVQAKRAAIAAAFVEASQRMDGVAVTASLCRIATLAPTESVRRLASRAVSYRPEADVVPLLLATFVAPLDSKYQVSINRNGDVTYAHDVYAGGEQIDTSWIRRRVARIGAERITQQPSVEEMLRAAFRARLLTLDRRIEFEVEARKTELRIADYNRVAAASNERVVAILSQVTGESLGAEPRPWWDYWQEYSGYDTPYERPVEEYVETSEQYDYCAPPPPPPRCECFVAGTKVWTRDGLAPIETIRRGDLVLARDPQTGGLGYRAVVRTTSREPSPMVEIKAGEDTLRATVGHPFWVVGSGWKMARRLKPGDTLSGVSGPARVDSVEPMSDTAAFNLVVEGAANYYVGDAGLLVHDNTPRRPAVGLVARR